MRWLRLSTPVTYDLYASGLNKLAAFLQLELWRVGVQHPGLSGLERLRYVRAVSLFLAADV
ncbi:hypothetical protein B2M27_16805 [Kluyvera intermedia]|uniref:Uncharacterized protein n=1 Tax=Kluyvera intermedia TaxID=61648 RepID=A0ABX3UC99_KLUIN|nr:hypothetical protein B2M27_16805 [Kluyvera intermedia]